MKSFSLLGFISLVFLYACSSVTPEKYFSIAVLNTNMFSGFANNGMLRQLESPSDKLSDDGNETEPLKRTEELDFKIQTIESNFDKVKGLNESEDTKDMKAASMSLYEYVIPVYKSEYMKLAGLYDKSAPEDQILLLSNSIHDKYYSGFKERFDRLISIGKIYADKHNINVRWQD